MNNNFKKYLYLLKGKFITLEGVEGAGKSTQAKKLVEYLDNNGIKAEYSREPGGCAEAEEIRNLVISGNANKWDGITELLLMYAARRAHTEKKIKPLLDNNVAVICDRYFDSSMAYQGFGQQMELEKIKQLQKIVLDNFTTDLTIILDLPVEDGLKRANKRGETNRFEEMQLNFHKRVQDGFEYICKNDSKRCKKINVLNKDIDYVFEEILNIAIKHFSKK